MSSRYALDRLNESELRRLAEAPEPLVVLQPVGSVEPHGPHMALGTDTVISAAAAERAAAILEEEGMVVRIAPAVPYGVTECARQFCGAVSIPGPVLSAFLEAVVRGFLAHGAAHVCLVNNHLEPAQDQAVRAAVRDLESGRASVACPLTRRWARTLSDEFKSGKCHAGRYETSIILAADPDLVDDEVRRGLPAVDVSLSEKLLAGVSDFVDMGMDRAYAGAPALASADEGEDLLDRLAEMVAVTVTEAMAA